MLLSPMHTLQWVPAAVTVASAAYCFLATAAAIRFAAWKRSAAPRVATFPAISVLKPLKGADPEMHAALRSHCVQNYPDFEIVFGVTDPGDPAVAMVNQLVEEFPDRKIRLVICRKGLGANGKVGALIQLARAATSEYLLVNDSDILVESEYLKTIFAQLQQPSVGLVTCLYRGIPAESLGSRLEALGISTDFVPGVLTAQLVEGGLHFGLGSTLAFRRSDLDAIGGFEAIANYLADDYELGNRIGKLGRNIELSSVVVETNLPSYDLAGFWAHQLRWARTIRASRPGGYLGLLLTFTVPWAVATVLISPSNPWCWIAFAAAVIGRTACISASFRLLKETWSLKTALLLVMREFTAVAVWIAGWFGNAILWRGERFVLRKGKLIPQ